MMTTKEEFEDLMNETYPPAMMGAYQFPAGTSLRAVSPSDFDIAYNDYLLYLENEEE